MIIGGGPAGATAAGQLRKLDPESLITLVSDENYAFYKRSQIINLISNSCTEDDLFLKGKEFYDNIKINFRFGHVSKVIPENNQVMLDDGSVIDYDSLLIATGGNPRIFPWEGVNLKGVTTLYTLDDAKKVAKLACNAKNAVIIGGGSIAMKIVRNFSKIGLNISIIEKASHLWPIGFDRKVARIIEMKLKEIGVNIYLNEEVLRINGNNGLVKSVILKSKKELPADMVIITIGMKPNINFLNESKIETDKGILVDKYLRTNFPNIYAAGDVAQIEDPLYNSAILHPTWGNAKKQAKIAAKNMTGKNVEYEGTIPIQSIKVFEYKAIAAGITHSKYNYDEISSVSFQKGSSRKFVTNNDNLIGVLILKKNLNKKKLKPLIKKGVYHMVNVSDYKTDLLKENFNFNNLIEKIEESHSI